MKRCTKKRARKGLCHRMGSVRRGRRICRKANGQIKRCSRGRR